MKPGKTVITNAQGETTIVVKDVDAQVCDLCGAWYLEPQTRKHVRQVINNESQTGHEISIIKLPKVASGKSLLQYHLIAWKST